MKTVLDSDLVSIHLWHDDSEGTLTPEGLYLDGDLVDPSLTDSNATIVEGITPPPNWYGRRFILADGEWSENPNNPLLAS